MFAPPGSRALPSGRVSWATQVTPIGRALRVAGGRAPSVLHFLSLVRVSGGAAITVVMRMQWPPDGPGTDVEITGAGPHHLPYGQLWAVDDQRTRYAVRNGRRIDCLPGGHRLHSLLTWDSQLGHCFDMTARRPK